MSDRARRMILAPIPEVCGPAPLSPTAEKPDAAGSGSTAVVGPVLGAK